MPLIRPAEVVAWEHALCVGSALRVLFKISRHGQFVRQRIFGQLEGSQKRWARIGTFRAESSPKTWSRRERVLWSGRLRDVVRMRSVKVERLLPWVVVGKR
jgi:hypothetical protein